MARTAYIMFEALFDKRLKPQGAFEAELRKAGYDASRTRTSYPTEVWHQCLELAVTHATPGQDRPKALQWLGREFCLGFFQTLPGRLVKGSLQFMRPPTLLRRFATYLRMGREDVSFELVEERERGARGRVHNPTGNRAYFIAGTLEVGLEQMGVAPRVTVEPIDETNFWLDVSW